MTPCGYGPVWAQALPCCSSMTPGGSRGESRGVQRWASMVAKPRASVSCAGDVLTTAGADAAACTELIGAGPLLLQPRH